MNGEFASVSCELEAVTCSTETASGATKATLRKGLSKAWSRSWQSLARMWTKSIDAIERMIRVCDITPVACKYPL